MEPASVQTVETDNAIQILTLIEKKSAETISFEVAGLEIAKSRLESVKQKEALSSKSTKYSLRGKKDSHLNWPHSTPLQSETEISP